MSPFQPLQPQVTKEDSPTLRLLADRLVSKLSALVPHLHILHENVTGSIAPTDNPPSPGSPSQGSSGSQGSPGSPGGPAPIPSIDTSLTTAHAIVNRLEDDIASLRSKV